MSVGGNVAGLFLLVGLVALAGWIGGRLGVALFVVYDAICRFLAKPAHIVIPGTLAWGAATVWLICSVGTWLSGY